MRHPTPDIQNAQRIIRASELAQYAYCEKAWWLGSVLGVRSANTQALQRGEVAHRTHGRQVWAARVLLIVAAVLIVIAAVVLAALLISAR